jgi:glycosidase
LLTTPGTPMIYYGEEIGMKGEKASAPDYDKTRREPMDWYASEIGQGMASWYKPTTRYNKAADQISVEEQVGKSGSLLEHYRALVLLRNSNTALRSGSFERITVDDSKIYAYLRADDKGAFLVVLNLADTPSSLALDLGNTSLPDGTYSAIDALTKKSFDLNGLTLNLNASAKTGYVLQMIRK